MQIFSHKMLVYIETLGNTGVFMLGDEGNSSIVFFLMSQGFSEEPEEGK